MCEKDGVIKGIVIKDAEKYFKEVSAPAPLEKEQKPAKWSEEDEDAIEMAIIALEDMYDDSAPNDTYGGHNLPFNEAAKRLKSLRPQHHWKPSEEQMKHLHQVMIGWHPDTADCRALHSLYEDLKKL